MSKFKKWLLPILAAAAILGPVASAQSAEFGVQYDSRGVAPFVYLTTDFHLFNAGAVGVWFSPSVEVIFNQRYLDGWVQLQFLVDSPAATLSARVKYELIDRRQRAELRLGLLIGR